MRVFTQLDEERGFTVLNCSFCRSDLHAGMGLVVVRTVGYFR